MASVSTMLPSGQLQPSLCIRFPSFVSHSTYLLLLKMATQMIKTSHLEQSDAVLLCYFTLKNSTNSRTVSKYNGLMDYSVHFESYAHIWVRVDLFRNVHVGNLFSETFVAILILVLRNKSVLRFDPRG